MSIRKNMIDGKAVGGVEFDVINLAKSKLVPANESAY